MIYPPTTGVGVEAPKNCPVFTPSSYSILPRRATLGQPNGSSEAVMPQSVQIGCVGPPRIHRRPLSIGTRRASSMASQATETLLTVFLVVHGS